MDQPNIVLIVLDAVRPDHLSCYGHTRETTPTIDRLADEGVRYENAFSNSIWTAAAHPPIFTGQLLSESGVYGDQLALPDDTTLLAERLSDAGYRTFGTSAGAHIRRGRGYHRGFDVFRETHRIQPNVETVRKMVKEPPYRKQVAQSLTRGPDDKTLYKFESLDRFMRDGTDPVFAFFNCKTAHYPYNPPRPYKSMFCPDLERPKYEFVERMYGALGRQTQSVPGIDIDKARGNTLELMPDSVDVPDELWDIMRSWYDGAIRYLDHCIGTFVETLRDQGELDDTYIIVTADHGEMFGEKGITGHVYSLYDSLLRIPLVIRPPGGESGLEITDRVSLVDLFNTILDMADQPTVDRPHSASLLPLADGMDHEYTYAEMGHMELEWLEEKYPEFEPPAGQAGPLQSVRDDEFKLIWDRDDHVELYRYREDPDEHDEVSAAYPDITAELQSVIEENLAELRTGRRRDETEDEELLETLEHLGYRG